MLSVSKILIVKIKERFDCEDIDPTEEEAVLGDLLLEKLCELVHDYVFVEDEELTEGASFRLQATNSL